MARLRAWNGKHSHGVRRYGAGIIMAKAIGPTFSAELVTAGLIGLPFTWGADGMFSFDQSMTAAQISAVQAVYAAHNPLAVDAIAVLTAKLAPTDTHMVRACEDLIVAL